MKKRKKNNKNGKNKRCIYSGRLTENKEVIIAEYAIEYVRKMGFGVTNFKIK